MSTLKIYLNKYRQFGQSQLASLEALLLWAVLFGLSLAAWPEAIDIWQQTGALLSITLLLALGALVLVFLRRHYPHRHFGWCNTVTFMRAAAVCWLAGLWFAAGANWPATIAWGASIAALLLLTLDGVDGWLARKRGNSSSFGARFDMEVDSLLALVLAVLVWQTGKVGAWVVLLGLFRPAFILASWRWPALAGDLPPAWRRKVVCVIQVAALALMLAPVVTDVVATTLAATVLALLALSFGRDTWWLLKQ